MSYCLKHLSKLDANEEIQTDKLFQTLAFKQRSFHRIAMQDPMKTSLLKSKCLK